MPRKKRPVQQPLEVINYGELRVEIWDSPVIGRGRPAALVAEALLSQCVEIVCNDYLDSHQNWRPPAKGDYLKSGRAFQNALLLKDIGYSDGKEKACLRKRVYLQVINMIRVVEAIKASKPQP